jgi:hypothetical protein
VARQAEEPARRHVSAVRVPCKKEKGLEPMKSPSMNN